MKHPDGWEFALDKRRINLYTNSLSITKPSGAESPAWELDLAQGKKKKKNSMSWHLLHLCSGQWGEGGQMTVEKDTEVDPVLSSPQFSFLVISQMSERPGTYTICVIVLRRI